MNAPRATICKCEGFSNALPYLFFPSVCLGDVVLQDLTLSIYTRIVPLGPDQDLNAPHGRDHLLM